MATLASPKIPLILILGATGTGKSNLAIQLAQSLSRETSPASKHGFTGAEIVNADAMQLYRGLPIITNKVTPAEQQGIPHHLLDHITLEEEPWTVQQYVKEADRVIEETRSRGKLPIVVGGTSYYVYGLLFKDALIDKAKQEDEDSDGEQQLAEHGKNAGRTWPILEASTEDIYAKLVEVDPEMARRWHPNDRRKIQRSLEIYLRSGRKASDVYDEQKQRTSPSRKNGTASKSSEFSDEGAAELLRYDPIIFWLEAEDQVLKVRLNQRVDTMIENGLLLEAEQMDNFLQTTKDQNLCIDKSKGIWVSIGYKEMEPWIEALRSPEINDPKLENMKATCVEAVKAGTRQYARRQNRFIRIRLANALNDAMASDKLFLLDCTDLDRWQDHVLDPALIILRKFFDGEPLPEPSGLSQLAQKNLTGTPIEDANKRIARKCETCNKVLMTEKEWTNHIDSRGHKKVLQSIRKREMLEDRRKAMQSNVIAGPG